MKVHKVTLLIVDHDGLGAKSVRDVIENSRYPNRCIAPTVMDIDTRDIEWSDDHPINNINTEKKAFTEIFK